MVTPLLIGLAAVAVGFVLLRILFSSSGSEQSKRQAETSALSGMKRVKDYEQRIERLHRAMRNAPDRQREMMAKREEMLLRQKEMLKRRTELQVKKS
ncbi:hypothetical protein HYY73_03440 [Candidatus Woesearchaeota archaeon]|nr:hypothetical protein [Candidatus Woesearchaeota archaeon]